MTTTELETLNLIQPMDDTRREMYIRARARIVSGEQAFICWALLAELADTCNGEWSPSEFKFQGEGDVLYGRGTYILLEELFPEFSALHDGVLWPLEPSEDYSLTVSTAPHDAWFDDLDRPRRLRLLDFLITHR